MNKRWASGFTIVELLIVVLVIGILVAITSLGYNGVRKSTMNKVAQSDLHNISAEMERALQKTNEYPTTVPDTLRNSDGITLTVAKSGKTVVYSGLSPIQNGVLFGKVFQDLINEGAGRGVNKGGQTQDVITWNGTWNWPSMQFTGWTTKTWNVPVTSAALLSYADNFNPVPNGDWNEFQEPLTKNFYYSMVERFQEQGGTFPITSFWDSWASSTNGGVMAVPLPTNGISTPYYCVEAKSSAYDDVVWHITQDNKLVSGEC
ncbi:MAG: prepilin-type N-terminal cleavage/methylation domain-containing protein [Patescibacteria group bacterium]